MKIKIMADSTCDLSPEYIAAHGVVILPLQVNLNGRDYVDGVDITPDDIFSAVGWAKVSGNDSESSVHSWHCSLTSE